jgi:hypothetical protein
MEEGEEREEEEEEEEGKGREGREKTREKKEARGEREKRERERQRVTTEQAAQSAIQPAPLQLFSSFFFPFWLFWLLRSSFMYFFSPSPFSSPAIDQRKQATARRDSRIRSSRRRWPISGSRVAPCPKRKVGVSLRVSARTAPRVLRMASCSVLFCSVLFCWAS